MGQGKIILTKKAEIMGVTTWTDEQVKMMKDMIERHKSMDDIKDAINNKFGTKYTRNAVIGKSNRMGFGKKHWNLFRTKKQYASVDLLRKNPLADIQHNECRFINDENIACKKKIYKGSWCEECYKKVFQHNPDGTVRLRKIY